MIKAQVALVNCFKLKYRVMNLHFYDRKFLNDYLKFLKKLDRATLKSILEDYYRVA